MWPFKVRVGVTQGQSKTEIPLYIQVRVYALIGQFQTRSELFNLYFYTAD